MGATFFGSTCPTQPAIQSPSRRCQSEVRRQPTSVHAIKRQAEEKAEEPLLKGPTLQVVPDAEILAGPLASREHILGSTACNAAEGNKLNSYKV